MPPGNEKLGQMLQVNDIRDNLDQYIAGLQKRGLSDLKMILDEVLTLDNNRKDTQRKLDEVLAQANQVSKRIGLLMKEGKREEAEAAKKETGSLKEQSKELNERLQGIQQGLTEKLYNIPNVPHESVPDGLREEDNEIVKTTDDLPSLPDSSKAHWDLIQELDIIDFDLGIKVTGAGFPIYQREGARMVRAMVNYFLDEANKAGYREVQPPIVVNEASGYGTGQLPDKEGQMYGITDSQLFLIPTAEVPITNMFRDTIVALDDLPIKLTGYTPCFRREAGSWGAHVRGLNRLHQFDKVELVQIAEPDKSYQILDEMVAHVESLVQSLELPYRILRLCGGDLGFTSALTYDFEVYSAAQQKWLEVSSVSNFETYQANRLKLRYKGADGKKSLAHTLNGSALAIPRILAALLENNQQEDCITIPKVLQPYTGFEEIRR